MFYTSTQIVVTGSNVVRESGPRVGSLGYITEPEMQLSELFNDVLFFIAQADVYFFRYGYELKHRFERKKVNIILPVPTNETSSINYTLLKNRTRAYLKIKKLDKNLIYLTVSPVNDTNIFDSENKFCAKITSLLSNPVYKPFMRSVTRGVNDKKYLINNVNNLINLINSRVLYFFYKYMSITDSKVLTHKQNLLNKLILDCLYNNKDNFKELILFLNTVKLLEDRLDLFHNIVKLNAPKAIDYLRSYTYIMGYLFKSYELSKMIKVYGRLNTRVLENVHQLKTCILQEGNKVLNLSKKDNR
ncbi:MAG: hypothetical protein M0P43_10030 [Arcobacteraceae bacterium]|nr:hypothetical protein [Arcobacteraceae bacterium]